MRLELNLSDEQLQHLRSTLEHQAKHARMYQIRYVHKACDADMQAWRMVEIWSEGILAQLSAEETKENEPEETEEGGCAEGGRGEQ